MCLQGNGLCLLGRRKSVFFRRKEKRPSQFAVVNGRGKREYLMCVRFCPPNISQNENKNNKKGRKAMYKVSFYSKLLCKEVVKSFETAKDASEFAKKVNGIVVA